MAALRGRAIAVLGTASDVGKSVVVTALCRHLSDLGRQVAPFKAQNMSNNSGVTREGGELGRAQIVQALAARVEPHVDMNPVLVKPSAGQTSQIVLLGRALSEWSADGPDVASPDLGRVALAALERLLSVHEVVVIEGAGSCAEVNLRARDFVNFAPAHAADAPVLLVADIDRGGVFAQIVGTLEVLSDEDRRRVAGVIINRFRGDAGLFDEGVRWLEVRTGLPVLGVVPHLPDIGIDAEDAVVLERHLSSRSRGSSDEPTARVAVIRLPHISNFTDFDALERHPDITLDYVAQDTNLADYDLVILPGSKAVRHDLAWLEGRGLARRIVAYRAAGGHIAGICGGYQMLGRSIEDPLGVEGPAGGTNGLGLLDGETVFARDKRLTRMRGWCASLDAAVEGYEIHAGTTRSTLPPLLELRRADAAAASDATTPEGAVSTDGRVLGTYLHGLFDSPRLVQRLLARVGVQAPQLVETPSADAAVARLTEHFRRHVDVAAIEGLIGSGISQGHAGTKSDVQQ